MTPPTAEGLGERDAPVRRRSERTGRYWTVSPCDGAIGLRRQRQRQCFHGNRCVAASRRSRVGRMPRPLHAFGGSGAVPGAHTVVAGRMPAAYNIPSSVMPSRKPVSSPYPASASTTPVGTCEARRLPHLIPSDLLLGHMRMSQCPNGGTDPEGATKKVELFGVQMGIP